MKLDQVRPDDLPWTFQTGFCRKTGRHSGASDSSGYSDFFCDAMEELYTAFLQSGAKMIGKVPTSGYTYDDSKSVIDGKFCGLPIDEDNESELTDERLSQWVQQINSEA